ncbi:MAG: hypothetical protein WBY94_20780 [Polyangiaceae bacterium]
MGSAPLLCIDDVQEARRSTRGRDGARPSGPALLGKKTALCVTDYRCLTVDIAAAAGRALVGASPGMTFIFVSGTVADSTGTSRTMWVQ